jgi:hypothetical protein
MIYVNDVGTFCGILLVNIRVFMLNTKELSRPQLRRPQGIEECIHGDGDGLSLESGLKVYMTNGFSGG